MPPAGGGGGADPAIVGSAPADPVVAGSVKADLPPPAAQGCRVGYCCLRKPSRPSLPLKHSTTAGCCGATRSRHRLPPSAQDSLASHHSPPTSEWEERRREIMRRKEAERDGKKIWMMSLKILKCWEGKDELSQTLRQILNKLVCENRLIFSCRYVIVRLLNWFLHMNLLRNWCENASRFLQTQPITSTYNLKGGLV